MKRQKRAHQKVDVLESFKLDLNQKHPIAMKVENKVKKAEVTLDYQSYIGEAPQQPEQMHAVASSRDTVTIDYWLNNWIRNIQENHKKFGSFKEHSVGKLFDHYRHKPVIVAGSGPSLKRNGEELKFRGDIGLISCLHNFHYFEDRDIPVDFYVTLDAGEVTVEEVYEGGAHPPDWYWERTKDKTLISWIGSNPELLRRWQGKVYFYNCPVPNERIKEESEKVERFRLFVTSGGNVLGASTYIAKAIMGANPITFVGADFSFGYDKKFHAWESKYDHKMGNVMWSTDVFGNKVYTWSSYWGFKCWFDWLFTKIPGLWINCTEGGLMGAYPQGNILHVKQMDLLKFIEMYMMHENNREACEHPDTIEQGIMIF